MNTAGQIILKKTSYALLIVSLLYLIPGVLLYIGALGQIFFPAPGHRTIRQAFAMLHQSTGDGFFGMLLVIFISAWVGVLFLDARINRATSKTEAANTFKKTQNKRLKRMLPLVGRGIMASVVLGFIWFGIVTDQVGGDIHYGANGDCYVTYRGEFKRVITLEQADAYTLKKEAAITCLVSSLVLGLTLFLFLICLQVVRAVQAKEKL